MLLKESENDTSKEKKDNKGDGRSRGRLLFLLALLTVYLVITLAVAVLFEYYTISTSGGEIIFSLSMSWQLILFIVEMITIIIQMTAILKTLKKPEERYYRLSWYAGIAACVSAVTALIGLLVTEGITSPSTVTFLIYALIITVVRTFILPRMIKTHTSITY